MEQAPLFDPSEIASLLQGRGATVEDDRIPSLIPRQPRRSVSGEAIHCLDKFRRAKTWDIAVDEMEERHGPVARRVVKLGLATDVFRGIGRDTSGGRKEFFRFAVDRERLFAGQLGPTADEKIDRFWEALEREFPSR